VVYGITVDGSNGPRHKVKPGALVIARECEKPIILVHVGAMEHPPADIGSDGNPSSFQRCAAIRARPLSSSMRMSGPCSKRFACVWKPISTTSRMSPFGFRAEVNRTSIENDG
jgi:hypothetical protein